MDLIKKAINNNEIVELLEGKDGYSLENDSWTSISTPIDWTRVVPMIYQEYSETQDESIKEKYEAAIEKMLLGSAEDVYCGFAVLYFQMLRESTNRSPFFLNMDYLIQLAKEGISKNSDDFKKSKKWSGAYTENGLWDEIDRYKKLFLSKFSIEF